MATRAAVRLTPSHSRDRASSFDFVKMIVWVAAAAVPWMGIAFVATTLVR